MILARWRAKDGEKRPATPLSRVAGLTVSLVAGAAVMGIVSEVEKPQVQLSIKPPQNAIAFIAELPRAQRDRRYISGEALAMEARPEPSSRVRRCWRVRGRRWPRPETF